MPPRFSAACDIGVLLAFEEPLYRTFQVIPSLATEQNKTPPSSGGVLLVENARSDRHLEIFCRAESNFLAGFNLNGLARHRVAAHAGGTFAHQQNT
jgi:hypothetical protein